MPCTIDEQVEALGLFAAQCEVMSLDPTLTLRERMELADRSDRYRNLQFWTLSQMPSVEKIVAVAIIKEMEENGL